MKFVYDGEAFEFTGEYRDPKRDEWFLTGDGDVYQLPSRNLGSARAIVHPVVEKVVQGGIEWEVVGSRLPKPGDWVCDKGDTPWLVTLSYWGEPHRILKPLRVV